MMIAWREGTFGYHCGMRNINVITVNVNRNGLCLRGGIRAVLIHRFKHYIVDVYDP
jgi:hypothetical protein